MRERHHETGKLVVAYVQCKFVVYLDKSGVEYFPVVYTTADQKSIAEATFADGVYFTETELFEFTSPLGVLRLHKEKLGAVAGAELPFLCPSVSVA